MYLGTERQVLRVSVERCQHFLTRESCLSAMDPYCGWDESGDGCTTAPLNNPLASYWEQNAVQCKDTSQPGK